MSWKEAFELYFEEQMLNGLFKDLEYYGIKPPRHVQWAIDEKEILSHQVYWVLYQYSHAAAFSTTIPDEADQAWLQESYPETWPVFKAAVWDKAQRVQDAGGRYFNPGLPQLCTVCQIPMGFTEPGDPMTQCQRQSVYEDERYDFCSDGCQWIFDREPTKYRQSWLPVHQIYQGNCGGPTLPDVAAWYGLQPGDGGEYLGSPDHQNWLAWHGQAPKED
jgi:phenol hydroxylase P3 protein